MNTPAKSQTYIENCIRECLECYRVCSETLAYCLPQGGRFSEARQINLLLDCAGMCETAAAFLLRNSQVKDRLCALSAEVCERCAEACERLGDDKQLKLCAEVCRRCVESCRRMALEPAMISSS